jgi:hypothetical protein
MTIIYIFTIGSFFAFGITNPQILKMTPKKNKKPAISPNLPESGYSIKK